MQQQAQQESTFPLKEVLLASGALSVVGMVYFRMKKQTVPFKVGCLHMWPHSSMQQKYLTTHAAIIPHD